MNKVQTFLKNRGEGEFYCGFLELEISKKELVLSYGGNMGANVKGSVDPILETLKLPSVSELKKMFPEFKEKGSPDYDWYIKFKLK